MRRWLLLLLLASTPLLAQEGPVDPFATPTPMRRRAVADGRGDVAGVHSGALDLPPIALRGLLVLRGKAPAALLEVNGVTLVARPGQRLLLPRPGLPPAPVDVLEVSADGLRLRTAAGDVAEVR
ncbi:MAG: hypothetical protein M9894_38445 [Planctomycetes bacterium]|nr:hypothetical protein [Planctomycetota bacterium]